VRAPARLYNDLDVVLRVARDYLGESKAKMILDSPHEYGRIQRQLGELMPDFAAQVELYKEREPIFDAYGIETEIENALRKEVVLKSGGSIIVEQTEALTVIDVNTGRFVGRRNLEETILRANLDAVKEIVYQLRLRNIGGIIVVDFIDMGRASNREKVYRALLDALKTDKARTNVLKISELGLVQMTRKRTRESLGRMLTMPCFYCEGRAHLKKKQTLMNEMLRELQRRADDLPGMEITIHCHPDVARFIAEEHGKIVDELEKRYQKKVVLATNRGFHFEHFELHGKKEGGGGAAGGGGGGRGGRGGA
jgi:ribonuclease G